MKRFLTFILTITALIAFSSCAKSGKKTHDTQIGGEEEGYDYFLIEDEENAEYVVMETSKGNIIIQLFPEAAPVTVANFRKLVNSGFYDGIIFHRVTKKFVIQAGDPTGTGYEGSKDKIKGEFAVNGWNNPIHHERGVLSMARNSLSYDSGSSQFFICLENSMSVSALDGSYAAFGKVIAGMDAVDAIAAVNVDYNDKPVEDQVIIRAFLASVVDHSASGNK